MQSTVAGCCGIGGYSSLALSVLLLLTAALLAFHQSGITVTIGPSESTSTIQAHGEFNSGHSEGAGFNRTGTWPFLGARLRGYVEKKGVAPAEYYLQVLNAMKLRMFNMWLASYANGTQQGLGPPFQTSNCKIAVDHKYKYIWIRGYKVGSTTTRGPLRTVCTLEKSKAANRTCIKELGQGGNFTAADVEKWWREYFVFGVVRNPYTHFASGEEFIGKLVAEKCGKPAFLDVCMEPFFISKMCKQKRCCNGLHCHKHLSHMSDCLFDHNFNPVVDFLAEVENLDEDLGTIIKEINKRRDPVLPPLNYTAGRRARKNKDGRRLMSEHGYAYDLYKQHQVCLPSVYEFYKRDFDLLGYERINHLD